MCVDTMSSRPLTNGSLVPRLRTNRGCEPPAIRTRIRDPARNRCAVESSSMRTVSEPPETGCGAPVSVAHIAGDALGVHFADAHEHVVVRVVAGMRQLDDRCPDDIEVGRQPVAGEAQHVGSFGEFRVPAVAALGCQQSAADRRRGVHGVIGESGSRERCPAAPHRRADRSAAGRGRVRASSAASPAGRSSPSPFTSTRTGLRVVPRSRRWASSQSSDSRITVGAPLNMTCV